MRFSKTAAILTVLVTASACQTTETAVSKTTVEGRTQQVDFAGAYNPDCTPIERTVVRVTRAPQSGSVSIRPTTGFTTFRPNNVRVKCNTTRRGGIGVFYSPNPGFRGTDSFDVEKIYGSGGYRTTTYRMTVR